MVLESRSPQKFSNDINFHLENLRLGVETLQLDYNREKPIYLFCEKALENLGLIDKLLNNTNLSLLFLLATEVNRLFIADPYLSGVSCLIINSKRPFNPDAFAQLKITA
jgi:hypothetical protein